MCIISRKHFTTTESSHELYIEISHSKIMLYRLSWKHKKKKQSKLTVVMDIFEVKHIDFITKEINGTQKEL